MASPAPQDRWSQDKHIELVNIIGNLGSGMLNKAMAKELSAASAHECLFVDSLSEEEPKKMKEEVYVKQPSRFESNEFLDHVCKLDKALYGLKQAPRAWYETLSTFLTEYKFVRDSDYAGCNMHGKSTSGAYQLLGGKLMCWSAKKQRSVAMSLAEVKHVAATRCCANILWMKIQLTNYDIIYEKVPIFCDNISAIAISNNPVLHSRTKHIDIIYHFIRDHTLKGDMELHFLPTQYQLADIFTKPLDEPTFKRLICKLGMLNIDGSKPEPSNDSLDED
nr:retrovirus-related Pol polyprotein from transposon TNT 1-94 [Tanacetum cinerariifolium]